MPTDAKRQAVSELAELLRASSALAVADYRGLTVSEMHTVRKSLRANGVSLQVAKNRLLKIAADEAGLDQLKPLLEGPTAIASTTGDEVSLARALQDAFRPYKVVSLRGGLLAGQPVSAADLGRLATLPSRDVLLGRLAGGFAAPLAGMAAVLAANVRNLAGVLNAVADQKRQTEVAVPIAEAEPAEPAEQPESAEQEDQVQAADEPETAEQTEPAEQAGQAEQPELAEQTGSPEQTDGSEQTDRAEPTERTEPEQTDQVEQTEPAEPAEPAEPEQTEQPEQTEATDPTSESSTDKENV
jgi:large subunit ribosomal protein L10